MPAPAQPSWKNGLCCPTVSQPLLHAPAGCPTFTAPWDHQEPFENRVPGLIPDTLNQDPHKALPALILQKNTRKSGGLRILSVCFQNRCALFCSFSLLCSQMLQFCLQISGKTLPAKRLRLALLWWSGAKPAISLKYTSTYVLSVSSGQVIRSFAVSFFSCIT